MATKTSKKAPKTASKKAQPETIENPKVLLGSVLTGEPVCVPDENPEPKTEPPEIPKAPEWQKALEEDYGHIIRNRDQTALLTAILTELVKIRVR